VETVARSVARAICRAVIARWDDHRTVRRLSGQDDGSAKRSAERRRMGHTDRQGKWPDGQEKVRVTLAASVLDRPPMVPPMAHGG
jgi:hypothetical protein